MCEKVQIKQSTRGFRTTVVCAIVYYMCRRFELAEIEKRVVSLPL